MKKLRANRNKTITINQSDYKLYEKELFCISEPVDVDTLDCKIINQDVFDVLDFLPKGFVDLLILDPPYNLNKTFSSVNFKRKTISEYICWFEDLLCKLLPVLKPAASVYVCSEWFTSTAIHIVLDKHLIVRNRITWEREKGRGAKKNWKNASEDIWFATVSDDYLFNIDDVKLKRRVLAPYTDKTGAPKDWDDTPLGQFRLTYPSNLWNDITVPFWSMAENTDHPTQKPEKLFAKLILAGTNEGGFVFDPFMGVGSSIVTAKKLNRRFLGIEIDKLYCLLAAKRLRMTRRDKTVQGYQDGIFWERNALKGRKGPITEK